MTSTVIKKQEAANNIKERLRKLNMSPVRLFFSALLGNLVVSIYSILSQKNIYENASRLATSLTLIVTLLTFTFQVADASFKEYSHIDDTIEKKKNQLKQEIVRDSLKVAIDEQKAINNFVESHRNFITNNQTYKEELQGLLNVD